MEGVAGEVCPRMGRGAYFGERALLFDAPRAATVTAVADTKCLAMDRAAFVRIMGPLTDLLSRNMEVYDKFVSN
jgi:CRP-like cAMP-binding protein